MPYNKVSQLIKSEIRKLEFKAEQNRRVADKIDKEILELKEKLEIINESGN